jgi:GTP-binding protein HflX
VLLHVVDINHPSFMDHIESVNEVLGEIHSMDKPTVLVFNKIDQYTFTPKEEFDLVKTEANYTLEDWRKTWMSKMNGNCVFISAVKKENIQELRETIYRVAATIHAERFPFNQFLY